MKKLLSLVLVLCVAGLVSATTISLVGPAAGALGSAENPAQASDIITIGVVTDGGLLGLDALLTISGPGTILDGLKPSEAASYGWDATMPCPPIMAPQSAEIGGANFSGNMRLAPLLIGYITVHCDGPGDVIVTLAPGYAFGGSFDINYGSPEMCGSVIIHQIPEPATIAVLSLGGLLLRRKK